VTGTVQTRLLAGWSDPVTVFAALYATKQYAFWLDAGPGASAGTSYLGAASSTSRFVTASVAEGTVTSRYVDARPSTHTHESVFDFLRRDLVGGSENGPVDAGERGCGALEAGGFELGWVGWLGYELGVPATVGAHESPYPDAALLEVHRMVRFDHSARTLTLVARRVGAETEESIAYWFDETAAAISRAPVEPFVERKKLDPGAPGASAAPLWRHDRAAYASLIESALAAIRDGDAYQLCLTNEIRVPGRWNPVDTYSVLRTTSPSHHGGLLLFDDLALLSASPEQFLHVNRDRHIRTKPIKGTRPRSDDSEQDARLKTDLLGSEKERAENLMIVDLMRNDLGRIAELGSVAVSSLLAVESYPHVHQLVSTIEAQLSEGVTVIDAIEACFPAGSMTGAPKHGAMTILNALENGPRGIYSGAFGYIDGSGAVDLAIVIRSIVLDSFGASIGTGGGITALSDSNEEIEETRIKVAALLASLAAAAP